MGIFTKMEPVTTHISPRSGIGAGFRELWQYRELFYFFTWRDIKVKYKQTWLGITWVLLQPLAMMAIFTFLFARTWPVNPGTVAYPVFVLAGLLGWNLFYQAVQQGSESMLKHAAVINKIYFPRIIIPGSALLTALFDCLMSMLAFAIVCIIYRQYPSWSALVYIPAGLVLISMAALGMGTWLAALTVKYRDMRYTIPFGLQLLFFSSQVIYPLQSIPNETIRIVLALNPVNAGIELLRAAFYHTNPDSSIVSLGIVSTLLLLIGGIYYFRKTESYFADLA